MNILVSNDDGIQAEGLQILVKALSRVPGNRVYVSAPDGQRSACGHGITMTVPIVVRDGVDVEGAVWAQALSGTPADCVKFGISRLKKEQNVDIDVVFSGINQRCLLFRYGLRGCGGGFVPCSCCGYVGGDAFSYHRDAEKLRGHGRAALPAGDSDSGQTDRC